MKGLVQFTINKQVIKRIEEIQFTLDNPIEKQHEILLKLITKARKTRWGKTYNFKNIHNYEDFKNNVPVQDYNTLKPLIDQCLNGHRNILWPGRIKWFAKSSGTTSNKSKYIPVTKESLELNHYKAGRDLLSIYYSLFPESEIYNGKGLVLGGSHQINKLNRRSNIGDLSAILLQNLPIWAKLWKLPSMKTAMMADWEEKIESMANEVVDKNITHITGVPTWTVVLINRILEMKNTKNLLDIWPNLELYVHGGVSFTPYENVFKNFIPSEQMTYLETYNASEGFFGLQNSFDTKDMMLLVDHGIYYEFIPTEQIGKEEPEALNLSEVEIGKNYALVISSFGGLWRYMIGDTIRFTSLKPFKFRLTGRTKNFINAFGEELIIENAEKAISEACRETNSEITDFTAGPVFFSESNNGSHEWIIEFNKEPEDLDKFKNLLDKNLQLLNSDYEAKRYKDIALSPPIINKVAIGTFYNWMKKRGKLGGQNKVPRLFNDRTYIEDILKFLDE